jgi:hypothetical protein
MKQYSTKIEGSVTEGQMDPFVVGRFSMTPVVASMAAELKLAAKLTEALEVRWEKNFTSSYSNVLLWLVECASKVALQ